MNTEIENENDNVMKSKTESFIDFISKIEVEKVSIKSPETLAKPVVSSTEKINDDKSITSTISLDVSNHLSNTSSISSTSRAITTKSDDDDDSTTTSSTGN